MLGALIGVVAGAILCYAISSTAQAGIWDESPGVAILAVEEGLRSSAFQHFRKSGELAAAVRKQ